MLRIIALIGLFCFTFVYAQPPDTLWSRVFDTSELEDFSFGIFSQTNDNGLLVSEYHQDEDISIGSVQKLDDAGSVVWETFFNTLYKVDLYSAIEKANGEIAMLGVRYASPPDRMSSIFVTTLSSEGDSLRSFEIRSDSVHYTAYSLIECADEGYAIATSFTSPGASGSFGHVIKTDSSGIVEWENSIGNGRYSLFLDVEQTSDLGFILAGIGCFDSLNCGQIRAVKLSSNGDIEWDYQFGDAILYDEGLAIGQTADGGYLVGGSSYAQTTGYDFTVIRLDSNGQELWTNTFWRTTNEPVRDWEMVHYLEELPNGDILMIGSSEPINVGEKGVVVARLDPDGTLLWCQLYASGGVSWGGIVTNDGYVVTAGWEYFSGNRNTVVLKLDRVFSPSSTEEYLPLPTTFHVTVYPNPFNHTSRVIFNLPITSHVKVEAFNSLGQRVSLLTDEVLPAGKHAVMFDGSTLASGEYFILVNSGMNSRVVKTVLLK